MQYLNLIHSFPGQLSSKHANRVAAVSSGVLSESLQFWMSCRATRGLIDITTKCLSCLMNSNTDSCINALLGEIIDIPHILLQKSVKQHSLLIFPIFIADTCVAHSPHFDWVVAHVGSCFPRTVMTRVLSCGLKDFCSNQQGPKAPKLSSVVQILGYLATSHSSDMRRALLRLFQVILITDHLLKCEV